MRELEPRDDQHPVADECPLGLQVDRGDVGVEGPGVDKGATVLRAAYSLSARF